MPPDPTARALAALLAVAAAAPLPAQGPVALAYQPAVGARLATWSEFEIQVTYVGFPAIPDSATATASLRLAISERVLAAAAGRYRVRLTYDSARAAVRRPDGSRRDVATPAYRDVSYVIEVDERLRRSLPADAGVTGDSAILVLARARRGLFEVPLPETAPERGRPWRADVTFTLDDLAAGGEFQGLEATPLTARLTATLDSAAARGTEVLAFVSVAGDIAPATMAVRQGERDAGAGVTGAMAASLIWSSAWNGWVSGVVRARLDWRVTVQTDAGPVEATMVSVVDGRLHVRP